MGLLDQSASSTPDWRPHAAALRETASWLYSHGWAYGTSGNYSVTLNREPLRLLVTASGRDKSLLTEADFVVVDHEGKALAEGNGKPMGGIPSAETLLHVVLAGGRPDVGAILHLHSVWNTLLSDFYGGDGFVALKGWEMLKGLRGVTTHEAQVDVPVFDNTQDIPKLAEQVRRRMLDRPAEMRHAFLIRGHGLYTWGRNLTEARRHVEILEFLFEVMGRKLNVTDHP